MKKAMFNNKYRLTQAVLEGRKTQTRRIIKCPKTFNGTYVSGFRIITNSLGEQFTYLVDEDEIELEGSCLKPAYKIGEEVAVAQSYRTLTNEKGKEGEFLFKKYYPKFGLWSNKPGWSNKMFVEAGLMPHRIKITNIRVERLQDISDEDCLKEGIKQWDASKESEDVVKKDIAEFTERLGHSPYQIQGCWNVYEEPRHAFADLIDKTCGKGTWDSNPWVFVYDFGLIK